MLVLRYGVTTSWAFRGFNLPPGAEVQTAFLTIKDAWATPTEEQGPEPPRLQLAVVPPANDQGSFTQDDEGNWSATFDLTAEETSIDLEPTPRYLYYEVTLIGADADAVPFMLRPIVGQVRMLADVFTQQESS